jgi:hypothetical protein
MCLSFVSYGRGDEPGRAATLFDSLTAMTLPCET